jgi:hypothetical protein
LHVKCTECRCLLLENCIQFDCVATLFAVERVTGIEPALSAWESDMDLRSRLPWSDLT